MKIIAAITAALAFLALAACTHTPVPIVGAYMVAEVDSEQVFTEKPIKVTYTGDRLSGRGPINTWNIPVGKDGKLGMGMSTKMAGPPELMQLETNMLQAFDGGTLKTNADGVLLVEKDGKVVVELTPVNAIASPSQD